MLFNAQKDKNQKLLLKLLGKYYVENDQGEKIRINQE